MSKADTLAAELTEDRRLYYIGKPRISDDEFDTKERRLKSLSADHDYFKQVGTPATNSRAMVKHDTFMGSLDNAFEESEINASINRIVKLAEEQGLTPKSFLISPKMDGLSVQLSYRKGKLRHAALRNTGTEGEDVTANIINAGAAPRLISEPDDIDVRGEVTVSKKAFAKFLADEYANERAAAAGILRGGAQTYVSKLRLSVFGATPINVTDTAQYTTLSGILDWLDAQAFTVVPWERTNIDVLEVAAVWKRYLAEREAFPHLIDGIVVAVNSVKVFNALGMSATCPRAAFACKWRGQQVAQTKVIGIRNSVGHTGKITPVALIEPVPCGGVTIQNVSLMNWDEVRRIDVDGKLGVGATVQIERAGDVIPRVTKLLTSAKVRFERPASCPVCDSDTEEAGPFQVCRNPDCTAQTYGKIMRWLKGRNILHLGAETVDRLMAVGGPLRTIHDLYTLSRSHLIDATRSEAMADKILAELEKSKDCTAAQLLGNIGIPGIGEIEAAKVVKVCGIDSRRKLMDLWEGNDGRFTHYIRALGEVQGQKFGDGVTKYSALIRDLWKTLRVSKPRLTVQGTEKWHEKTFCITGATELARPMLIKAIENAGGIWKSSVVKGLHYLIMADADSISVKARAAREKGVTVISEVQALEWANF